MIITTSLSKNFSKKLRKNKDIKLIVIHYTGMQSKIESIKRLSSPKYKVSCHYLIDRKGQILKMIEDNKIAWHAGKSKWKNYKDLNKCSIGIELVNKGHEFGYEKFPSSQVNNLIKLCKYLKKKYKIKDTNIVGHSDIAPLRKKDPGEKFPWKMLKKKKIGIWYKKLESQSLKWNDKKIKKLFFKNLFRIGYRYFERNRRTEKDIFVIQAFQRRFFPNMVTGKIDQKTYKISHFLAKHLKN